MKARVRDPAVLRDFGFALLLLVAVQSVRFFLARRRAAARAVDGARRDDQAQRLVQVKRFRVSKDGAFAQFAVLVFVPGTGRHYVVWRRYSELRAFHKKLASASGDVDVPAFPPKHSRRLDAAFLGQRVRELDAYFEHVFSQVPPRVLEAALASCAEVLGIPASLIKPVLEELEEASRSKAAQAHSVDHYIDVSKSGLKMLLEEARSALGGTGGGGLSAGWTKWGRTRDVDIYLKPEGGLVYSLGKGEIKAPLSAIMRLFLDASRRRKFDELFDFDRDIYVVNPEELPKGRLTDLPGAPKMEFITIRYSAYQRPMPGIAARDDLSAYCAAMLEDGSVAIALRSVQHPDCPPLKKYVRTNVLSAGLILKEVNPELVEVVKFEAADVGGDMPKWLVNQIGPLRALMVADIGKALVDRSTWGPLVDGSDAAAVEAFVKETFEQLAG